MKLKYYRLLNSILILISSLFSFLSLSQTTIYFTNPGANSWTVPCGVTSMTVEIYGAGGAGGGSGSGTAAGAGGGAGGYCASNYVGLVPGTTYNFTIGAGGIGGVAASGTSGGATTFLGMTANGGSGGLRNRVDTDPGGNGGNASGGNLANTSGGSGASPTVPMGGNGGTAPGPDGGIGGDRGNIQVNGDNGVAFGGGGGGGGSRASGTSTAGGNGADGGVVITYTSTVTAPLAGADQSTCAAITLSGNIPDLGWCAQWSVVSGTATITSPGSCPGTSGDPNSPISGVPSGTCATIRYTFSSPGCPDVFDDVLICTPAICNDDPCNATPLAVTSGTCSFTSGTNVGATYSTGMPEPACVTLNGPDVWYSIVVPASGQVQLSANTTGTGFDEVLTAYDGACTSLEINGCVDGGGTDVYPLTYTGTPGSTIYLRVNEGTGGDAATGTFEICAYEATTAGVSEVLPGDTTTITCGSTLNFYDPGGQGGTTTTNTSQPPPAGNYTNNTSGQWIICPDDPSQYVQINFNEFTLESGFDKLIILSADTVIAQWTANDGQGDVVTSIHPGECLTVVLQSDYIYTAEGWEAVVSCTNTPIPAQITNACEVRNCNGGCGVWVCEDGIYDTEAGAGAGIDEVNETTGGCWGAAGEVATSWFYFTTLTGGELTFEFVPSNNGHNINFALYGPSDDGVPPCPLITGDAPIRCSFAGAGGINTGLANGQTESYEGSLGDGMVAPLTVGPGETYALVVDVYQNGQPPTQTQIDFTGEVTLDCTPVYLAMTLSDFSGINQDRQNYLYWTVRSQVNNDYFTVERSVDGSNWETVDHVRGDGTLHKTMYYSLIDNAPYFPVTYYRLIQTDFNGEKTYSEVIAITKDKATNGLISNLFPNPSSSFSTFIFNGDKNDGTLNVQLINEFGQIMYNYDYSTLNKGTGATIDTSRLPDGIYQVRFTQGDFQQIEKLSVIK